MQRLRLDNWKIIRRSSNYCTAIAANQRVYCTHNWLIALIVFNEEKFISIGCEIRDVWENRKIKLRIVSYGWLRLYVWNSTDKAKLIEFNPISLIFSPFSQVIRRLEKITQFSFLRLENVGIFSEWSCTRRFFLKGVKFHYVIFISSPENPSITFVNFTVTALISTVWI